MSGRLDSNQRPPEPHLRRQVANPWHSSPYTFNNTQETQDFNGFAKGLLRSVMRPGWSGRHSLPALLSGSRLPRLASQRSLPTPDTPAIATTSNAGNRQSGGDPFAVGTERHAQNAVGVPVEGKRFLPRLRVPHLHCLVSTPRSDASTVRGERHARDAVGVPLQ